MELFWVILVAVGIIVLGSIPLVGFIASLSFASLAYNDIGDPVTVTIISIAMIIAEVIMYIWFFNKEGFEGTDSVWLLMTGLWIYGAFLGIVIFEYFGTIATVVYSIIYILLFMIPPWLDGERCASIRGTDVCYGSHGLHIKR